MNDYSGGLGILIEEKEPQIEESSHISSPSKSLSISSSSSMTNQNSLTMNSHLTSESDDDHIPVNVILTGSSSPTPGFQGTPTPSISAVMSNTNEKLEKPEVINSTSEVLLPPLPDESDDYFVNHKPVESLTDIKSLTTPTSISNREIDQNDINEMVRSTSISNSVLHSISTSSNPNDIDFEKSHRYYAYELDSPSLKLDSSNLLYFPSLNEPSTSSQTTNLTVSTSSVPVSSSSSNTSPLKGLKSLKNGIRKLSLSKHSSSSNSQPTLQQPQPRPVLSPLQTNNSQVYLNLSASTLDSMKSGPQLGSIPISNSSNNLINSLNSSLTLTKTKTSRSRTLSNSQSSPATPPLASPVITLSENLAYCKKNLNQIEQNFFDTLLNARNNTDSANNSLYENESISSGVVNGGGINGSTCSTTIDGSTANITPYCRERIESISELNRPEELIDYSNYLNEQKKSTIDAFEITRDRLIKSGWCSDHDLNNLQLQQDSSLCQIDTKILQIEEKLNSAFNLSLLNKNVPTPANVKRTKSTSNANPISRILLGSSNHSHKDLPISPSLKTLESRLSFA